MMSRFVYPLLFAGCLGCLLSCNKKEFLDEKPTSDLFVPGTLQDFQTLLDNDIVMSETPVLGELSSDNFYLNYSFWNTLNTREHNAYIWASDIFQGVGNVGDWNLPYQQVFYANVVLDGLKDVAVTDNNTLSWNAIKGSALFIRAYAFYNVAQVFAPVYDVSTADNANSGIPLRLTPNIDEPSHRSTVNQTYTQILSDLLEAKDLLPDTVPMLNRNRPSKPAALALLARVYLSMRLYDKAGGYADSCLSLYNKLIDYNTVSPSISRPFPNTNIEAIYQSKLLSSTNVLKGVVVKDCLVDSTLYQSYDTNDLRRGVFYFPPTLTVPAATPKGSYNGTIYLFSGLATDEVYLIRAECAARRGDRDAAMSDLNMLLQKRWKSGTYVPPVPAPDSVLDLVLQERRKELVFRGLRWTDLRRLNKEGRNILIKRKLDTTYELPPNSPLYVLPIPPDAATLGNLPPNERD